MRLFDPGDPEPVPDPLPDRVVLCSACDGRAYRTTRDKSKFEVDVLRCCTSCKGSGIEGLTPRQAYLREFPPAKF